jgi:hypothetical protein
VFPVSGIGNFLSRRNHYGAALLTLLLRGYDIVDMATEGQCVSRVRGSGNE